MEQEEGKQNKLNGFSEILRCVLYGVVVVFLVSWMILLSLDHIQITQNLVAIDKLNKTCKINRETLKKFCSTSRVESDALDERIDSKALLLRRKRALALSLESLEKRLKVLETR